MKKWIFIICVAIASCSGDTQQREQSIEDGREKIRILDSTNNANLILQQEQAQRAAEAKMSDKARKIYKNNPTWSIEECEMIAKNQVWIGMHYDMLLYQRGRPNNLNTSNYGNGNQYQACWYQYDPSCFYFGEDQIVTSYN